MDFTILTKTDKESVKSYIDLIPVGSRYDISIIKYRHKRSLSQNSLYRLWLKCISAETGNDVDDLHDYFKRRFLSNSVEIFGEECDFGISTTKLNTVEFTAFLDKVQRFAANEGIPLPNPEDLCFEQFYNKYKNYI